jgi:hypothetical protein
LVGTPVQDPAPIPSGGIGPNNCAGTGGRSDPKDRNETYEDFFISFPAFLIKFRIGPKNAGNFLSSQSERGHLKEERTAIQAVVGEGKEPAGGASGAWMEIVGAVNAIKG